MKKKLFCMMLTLALILSFSLVAAVPAMAARPIHVNSGDSIQDAIDNASNGAIIYVHEGIYDESIVINGVDIKLIAVGDVTISPSTAAGGHGDIIQIYNCMATVDGFAIDGGLLSMGGIYARGMASYGESEVSVTITNNHVSGFKKNGITVNGELAKGFIKDNVVIGSGPVGTGYWAQNGIQFGYGSTGQALRNQVELAWYTGEDWTACGILIFEASGVSVKQNVVEDCQTGIGIETWGWYVSEASGNVIANNTVDESMWGITVAAYSWTYSSMDCFANNNKVVNNIVSTSVGDPEDTGIWVGTWWDEVVSFTPEADNNKIIHNEVDGFDNSIVAEGTATKVHSNIIPSE